jgi:hypothetical protein
MDNQKKASELSSWFKLPQGKDHPKGLATEAWNLCPGYLTIGGPGKAFQILMRISLNSQQPVFQICSKDDKASQIVFPLQNFEVMCGIEGRHSWNYALENLIQKFRTTCDFLQDWEKVAVYAFKALEEPIVPFSVHSLATTSEDEEWEWLRKRPWKGTSFMLWSQYKDSCTT